jgi:hypothetical protein
MSDSATATRSMLPRFIGNTFEILNVGTDAALHLVQAADRAVVKADELTTSYLTMYCDDIDAQLAAKKSARGKKVPAKKVA